MQRLPDDPCPVCRKVNDAVTCISEDGNPIPNAGDWTVCAGCGAVLRFNEDLTYRAALETELQAFSEESPNDYQMMRVAQMYARAHARSFCEN